MGCELSERHTNRFGCGERAYSTLQTERTMSPTASVCRREETNHMLPPCFCRRFVQPWSALPVRWTDCGKQCHVVDKHLQVKQTRKYRISFSTASLHHLTLNFWVVHSCVRSAVLTAVLLKIQVFFDVTWYICQLQLGKHPVAVVCTHIHTNAVLPGNYFFMFRKMLLPLSGSIGQSMETSVSTYSKCTYRTTQLDVSE
jgi:hypothetical protein